MRTVLLGSLVLAGLFVAGCKEKQEQPPRPPVAAPPQARMLAPAGNGLGNANSNDNANGGGGLVWKAPESWQAQGERPMRVATYAIPAVEGDPEPAELGVFYFGPNEGGGVEPNIQRWVNQFEDRQGEPSRGKGETDGMPVHRVEVTGTYTASGAPMMGGPKTLKQGFRLLGAIVQGPQGAVFFKLTGPVKTVEAARSDFDAFIQSVQKQQ